MITRLHSRVVQAAAALRDLQLDPDFEAELDMIEKSSIQQTARMLNKALREVDDGHR